MKDKTTELTIIVWQYIIYYFNIETEFAYLSTLEDPSHPIKSLHLNPKPLCKLLRRCHPLIMSLVSKFGGSLVLRFEHGGLLCENFWQGLRGLCLEGLCVLYLHRHLAGCSAAAAASNMTSMFTFIMIPSPMKLRRRLSVCLLAEYLKKLTTDLNQITMNDRRSAKDQSVRFWD